MRCWTYSQFQEPLKWFLLEFFHVSSSLSPSEPVQCHRPCKNGGVCVGLNRCRCAKGFTGSICEIGWLVCMCVCVREREKDLSFPSLCIKTLAVCSVRSGDHPLCATLPTWRHLQSSQHLYLSGGHCRPALRETVSINDSFVLPKRTIRIAYNFLNI